MSQKHGIKELSELLTAIFYLATLVLDRMDDKFDHNDILSLAIKILTDEHVKKKLEDGFKGIDKVSDELKDLDASEIMTLAVTFLPQILKLLEKMPKSEEKMKSVEKAFSQIVPVLTLMFLKK